MADHLEHQSHFHPDVLVLKDALGTHAASLTRYWIAAATITFLAVTTPTSDTVSLFGFQLSKGEFFPAAAIIGSIANFAYCISQLQAYETMRVFRAFVSSLGDKELVPEIKTVEDAAYLLLPSSPNRVFPIARVFENAFGNRAIKLVKVAIKLPVDAFVVGVPIAGPLWAANWILTPPIQLFHLTILFLVFASTIATIAVAIEIRNWKW